MTPAARYAAAIDILDEVLGGTSAEPACLAWTRGHRFAGSKDRAAIRDIVFSIERRRRSCAAMGGSLTGRGLVRGYLAQQGIEEASVFHADRYAPELSESDPEVRAWQDLDAGEQADLQPWMWETLKAEHGENAAAIAEALRHRAPVWLRVNGLKAQPAAVLRTLTKAGFEPESDPDLPSAIKVEKATRQLAQHELLSKGAVELQDLGPQRALAEMEVTAGMTVLDFCAGGGGKSLALAVRGAQVTAHDANPQRMKDLPLRARRAGANIEVATDLEGRKFDLVLCDVPCTGTGAFRRVIDGKWRLTPEDVETFVELQRSIVSKARAHLAPGGRLVYMTCSLLGSENKAQSDCIAQEMELLWTRSYTPLEGCDGFFVATFQ
ncbi:MAG: RsmB/NOP family class I SAM-dependent RNA methyltransferase [Rhodobacteraceae bacterium]|nr:RsmB/NOP family class I SAM-dependent RNA methyltransferase [Paracoccaceae bacterium]